MPSPVRYASSSQGPNCAFLLAGMAAATMLVAAAGSGPAADTRYPSGLRDAPANTVTPAPAFARRLWVPQNEPATHILVARELPLPPRLPAPPAPRIETGALTGAAAPEPVAPGFDADQLRRTFDGAAPQAVGAFSARLKPSSFSDGAAGGASASAAGSDGAGTASLKAGTGFLYRAPAGRQAFAPNAAPSQGPTHRRPDPRHPVVIGGNWKTSAAGNADGTIPPPGTTTASNPPGRAAWNNLQAPGTAAYQTASAYQAANSSLSSPHGPPGNASQANQDTPPKTDTKSDAATGTPQSATAASTTSGTALKTLSTKTESTDTSATDTGSSLIGATFNWERSQHLPIDGLTTTQRLSACGLIAAEALQRFLAKKPNLDNIVPIMNLAVTHGLWASGQGMHGPAAEHQLLSDMGVKADLVYVSGLSSIEQKIIGYLKEGKPVIVNTPRHYFFVEGYADGKFFVGHTGEIMSGFDSAAGPQMTISHINYAGNGISALIVP